jgi:hypothetical protein
VTPEVAELGLDCELCGIRERATHVLIGEDGGRWLVGEKCWQREVGLKP